MDYVLSHDWLLYPLVAYLALCVVKWQYVIRGMPHLLRCIHERNADICLGALCWLVYVWIPFSLAVGSLIVVPFSLFSEGRAFWRAYDDEEMAEIARDISKYK